MKLSVIILNYNVSYFLRQCILSVQEALAGIEAEIIVIDNNSQDDSCEMVKTHFPNIKFIENKENVGFSKANNQGVAIAKGEYVCVLNPDTAVAKETFKNVLLFAETKTNLGALGVRLIDGTGNFLPESKRNIPTPKVAFHKIFGFKSKEHNYYATHLAEDETGEADVLVGAFMLLKTNVYKEVNGFDEDYFMYGEDIDLSYKLLKANYKNYYLGTETVLHYKGESTTKDAAYLKRFYGAMHLFYKKHFKSNSLFKTLVFMGVSVARFLSIFRMNRPQNRPQNIENYFLLSDNISFLRKLSDATQIEFKSLSKSAASDDKYFNSHFVFDANYISYEKIFKIMENHKNKENFFRIRPVNTDYVVGSDSSHSKGEVFDFSKEHS
ncbi:MAG: glycosyltransferase family 2 protein [Flavobacteriaceae bacterium]|nr:glycosyltransferase family 2 protein [Flavobacteriaceae bacterium]